MQKQKRLERNNCTLRSAEMNSWRNPQAKQEYVTLVVEGEDSDLQGKKF